MSNVNWYGIASFLGIPTPSTGAPLDAKTRKQWEDALGRVELEATDDQSIEAWIARDPQLAAVHLAQGGVEMNDQDLSHLKSMRREFLQLEESALRRNEGPEAQTYARWAETILRLLAMQSLIRSTAK